MAFVKLDCGILRSTIWDLDAETCKVFITLLAMARPSGLVDCCSPGVAHEARLSIERTEECLAILESPDPRSRTKSDNGRRIERTEEGYLVLNYPKYRERDHTNAERQARFKSKDAVTEVTALPQPVTPLPSASASGSSSGPCKDGGAGEGEGYHGTGWNADPNACHIAKRWAAINPKTLAADRASHHFAEGLLAGIPAKVLMDAVEANRGQKPWDIVKALKPALDRKPAKSPEQQKKDREWLARHTEPESATKGAKP